MLSEADKLANNFLTKVQPEIALLSKVREEEKLHWKKKMKKKETGKS